MGEVSTVGGNCPLYLLLEGFCAHRMWGAHSIEPSANYWESTTHQPQANKDCGMTVPLASWSLRTSREDKP